ncbi:MAG: futalosine hydrolase [Desulfovermiculus sp.]
MNDNSGETRPLALVTATRKEMQAVLGHRSHRLSLGVNRWQQITWGPRLFILVITGIGPVNAALSMGRLLGAGMNLAGVLNLGIAGSFQTQSLPLGTVVGVETEIWPEFGLYTEHGLDPQGLGLGQGRIPNGVVWDRLILNPKEAARGLGLELDPTWPTVTSISVAGVSGTPERADELHSRTRAEVENMEGFALAWACALNDVPFLQVRSISNRVGSRNPREWDMELAFSRLQRAAEQLLGTDKDLLPGKGQ